MKRLLEIINKNNFFYIGSLLLTISAVFFLCTNTKANSFILLNGFHSAPLTVFFQNITICGDGIFSLLIFAIIMFSFKKHRELGIVLLIGYLSSGILSQIIKHFVMSPRPSVYFESLHYTYYLDTFSNCRIGFRSFPSGHTASVFAMVTVFSNYVKRRHIWAFLLLFAMMIGYSRIYLAHHFPIDVLAGATLGILSGTFSILWYRKNKFKIRKIVIQFSRQFNLAKYSFKNQHKPRINGSY